METNILSYPEMGITDLMSSGKPITDRFYTVSIKGDVTSKEYTITIDKTDIDSLFEQITFHNQVSALKENYCIVAIKNLIKKNEFLQLTLQLAQDLISEAEYDTELQEHSDKYLIQMNYLEDPEDIHIMSEILKKIGKSFNVDEVSELFSVDIQSLHKHINAYKKS